MTEVRSQFPANFLPVLSHWPLMLLAFGFAPLLATFFLNLWKLPEYQFFPQALAAAVFLAWDRWREIPRPMQAGHPALALGLLTGCFFGCALAVRVWSPWLATTTAWLATVAVLWKFGGWPLLRKMLPALVLVLTIIPPPLGLDVRLGLALREMATLLSSRMLDLLGVIHSVSGNVIDLPGQKLLVEEACSGINSLLFVTAFSLFYLFWRRRPIWCFLICVPMAWGFVVMGNVIRISLGACLRYFYGIDILTGWKHEAQSIVLVAAYVLLVISLDALFGRSHPKAKASTPSRIDISARPPAFQKFFGTLCLLFGLLGVTSSFKAWKKSRESAEPLRAAASASQTPLVFVLPDRIGDWKRSESGPPKVNRIETLGLSSSIWNFRRPGLQAVIAFDYPIWRYHDVAECYLRNGWQIERKEIVVPENSSPARFQLVMKKDPGVRGMLWFATINDKGEWVDQATVKHDLISRLGLFESPQETTFRVQLLLVGDRTPDPAALESAKHLFDETAAILSRQMLEQVRK
ncbi:MAG: exosortase U [Chthoniobacterales bacterium]|nr:exosortase U [Chthoniobacterales bacterium]